MMLPSVRTLIAVTCVVITAVACGNRELEVSTTRPVEILLLPERADVEGNKRVGVLPGGSTVAVKREVLGKDMGL
jgi:hypothetical protein